MLLIDTMMLIRRCYAKMDFLKNSAGVPTGMEFGTLRTLESLQKKYPDQRVVLCLDSADSWRHKNYPDYKANRKRIGDCDFYRRLAALERLLDCVYHTAEKEGYEADDVMHTLSRTQEGPHLVYTNDHDLLQSVSEEYQTVVLKSHKSELFVWNEDKVTNEYGLPPELLPEYFAFVGDKIDNVVGVPRIVKSFLVDLITWAHCEGLSRRQMLDEIRTAAWPKKLGQRVNDFIREGKWDDNYSLVRLKVLSDVRVTGPVRDDYYVAKKLREWEIYSLRLCREHGITGGEEF